MHVPPVPPSQLSAVAIGLQRPWLPGRWIGGDDGLVVHPHAPPVRAAVHLEHGHLGQGPDREPGGDLVVGRVAAGLRDLVVDVAAGDAREPGVADLDPLVRAVRAFTRAADADPAGDVTVDDVEGVERSDQRRDSVGVRRGSDAGVRVAGAVAAGEGPCRAAERDGRDRCGGEEEAKGSWSWRREPLAAKKSAARTRTTLPRSSDRGLG